MRVRLGLVAAGCVWFPLLAAGAEPAEVASSLKRGVIGSVLPLAEVQRFCEARVVSMPEVGSVEQWEQEAERIRRQVLEKIVYRGAAAGWRDAKCGVEWLGEIPGGPGYRIRKLRLEAVPGLWVPGLLYEPEQLTGRVPAVLNVNGHTALGKQYPPKQIRCINQAKRGMLALNMEWLGMGQLRGAGYAHSRMNQLDLCGTSGLAPFYLLLKRSLDLLLSLENTDPQRVAVTGLSGGGWQTILISALDTRVRLANPVAGYSSFRTRAYHLKDLGDSEQTPTDLATIADYTHLTALLAPRPALLTYNSKDNCCFESGYALQPLLDAARPIYKLYHRQEALRYHVNDDPGTHNYERDNREAFYRMLGDFFYPEDPAFSAEEIPCEDEVKSAEELEVELPEDNATFQSLALALCGSLPRTSDCPEEEAERAQWQHAQRRKLKEIVRYHRYSVQAIAGDEEQRPGVRTAYWRLKMDGAWTVPAVELVPEEAKQTVLLVADSGRGGAAAHATKLLEDGCRVLAVDPFYFGESKISQRPALFALLVAGVGERPLGIQAGQLAAAARWAAQQHAGQPVRVVAVGPRSSLFALVAAALEPEAIAAVQLHQSLKSLKQVIQNNWSVNDYPEMFCFGLLEAFDIQQLADLVAPRPVEFVDGSN